MGLLFAFTALVAAAAQVDTAALEARLLDSAEQNRRSFDANHQLGEFYIQQHKLGSAILYLERARSIDPAQYSNSYDLALAYLETGKFESSRKVIVSLLAVKDTAELHNLLGDIEAAESHIDAAARQYDIAARVDPSEKNLFDLGSFLVGHRGFEQGRIVFEYATGRFPKSARLRVGLGVAYYSLAHYDQAVEALCQAVDLDPKDTKALDFLGKMSDISPAYADEVTKRLARFVELYPRNAPANYYYGLALRKRGLGIPENAKSAEVYLAEAVKLDPNWASPHYELGVLHEDQADFSRAIREYEAAMAIEPGNPKIHYRLAMLYRRNGQYAMAEREMRAFKVLKGNKRE
jgi:tetratricopeptide (TPR) repeat protein